MINTFCKNEIDKHFTSRLTEYRKYCYNLCKSKYEAEDIFHNTYILILKQPEQKIIECINRNELNLLIKAHIFYTYKNNLRSKVNEVELTSFHFKSDNTSSTFDNTALVEVFASIPTHYQNLLLSTRKELEDQINKGLIKITIQQLNKIKNKLRAQIKTKYYERATI